MKRRMLLAFSVCFALVVASCSKETVSVTEVPQAENRVALEGELLSLVNNFRTTSGMEPLTFSAVAYQYANTHTDYMIASGNLSHDNFTSRASQISQQTNAKAVAENVAKDYPSAEMALQGWIDSPSHRSTMEGNFSHTAISVKEAPDGTLYYTQIFFLE
ncbi:CAP domain-containing protein [Robiginitalea myxolifaciens]|nr:CAP domain-containing protein [Robiginitalea myxolifaciens]